MATGRVPTTANSPLTAKGDLFGYSTTQARVAVGNDGETLVADSSTSTGLRYTSNFAAGKNKIINGDFTINQRAFTSNTASGSFNFDRWIQVNGGTTGTLTTTPQTFTPGAAPVAGYEGNTFVQCVTSAGASTNTLAILVQRIEDVRTFAGQTATISFWAKANTGTPKIAVEVAQDFGAGGSPSSTVFTYAGQPTISTSWARYSITVAVPSITGKTIGTTTNTGFLSAQFWLSGGSDFNARTGSLGLQNNTFQIWGVQVEAGSVATAFQTATGTIQGELAACQRYYWRIGTGNGSAANWRFAQPGLGFSTTSANINIANPVPMRVSASAIDFSALGTSSGQVSLNDVGAVYATTAAAISGVESSPLQTMLTITGTGLTSGKVYYLGGNGGTNHFGFTAEL